VNLDHLEAIRLFELDCVRAVLRQEAPAGCRLLKIGAGTGWQARELSQAGYAVEAIDIGDSNYASDRVWPIRNYDGSTIPFPASSFDVVFSSNVLEHIPHVVEFQDEIRRVLKPGGLSLHLVPSASWRLWTNATYYAFVALKIKRMLFGPRPAAVPPRAATAGGAAPARRSRLAALLPSRHGELGNAFSELYYFSRRRWLDIFSRKGWLAERAFGNGLFYTGYGIFGAALSLPRRQRLSRWLGSSCHVFVLRSPAEDRPAPKA
jgi:SAM-dependent methyltransferase